MGKAFANKQGVSSQHLAQAEGVRVPTANLKTSPKTSAGLPLFLASQAQPKLTVSQPNDPLEREADAVADEMSAAQPSLITKPACSCGKATATATPCSACQESLQFAQRKATGESGSTALTGAETQPLLADSGQPLSTTVRTHFEPWFQQDFSQVRVHTDEQTSLHARSFHARAFTIGRDVFFAQGEYAPETATGRKLLAHELTHVVQQSEHRLSTSYPALQRKDDESSSGTMSSEGATDADLASRAEFFYFRDTIIDTNRASLRELFLTLIRQGGIGGMDNWYDSLINPDRGIDLPFSAHARAYGGLRPRTALDSMRDHHEGLRRQRILRVVAEVYREVRDEAVRLREDFYQAMWNNTTTTLDANELQARRELARYGIRQETRSHCAPLPAGPGCDEYLPPVVETTLHIEAGAAATRGLQAAARVLLPRRREIDRLRERLRCQRVHHSEHDGLARSVVYTHCDDYAQVAAELPEREREYTALQRHLGQSYPLLGAFATLDQDIDGLEQLATQEPGTVLADTILTKVTEVLDDIHDTRDRLNDGEVNLWRLSRIVGLTKASMNIAENSWQSRVINDKVEDEQPGPWQAIAQLVINIGALLLAGPTGGLSLAVAAGVNIGLAAVHVQEYLRDEALAGTALDRADALAQERPSLFWLAFEIATLPLDVLGAASAMRTSFRTLAATAEVAIAAEHADEAARALAQLRREAEALHGADFAARVTSRAESLRRGASPLAALGVGADEARTLESAARVVTTEVEAGVRATARLEGGGLLRLTESGWLAVCHSPCTTLRERFATLLTRNDSLAGELEELERLAREAVGTRGSAAAQVEVAQRAAALETRLVQARVDRVLAAMGPQADMLQQLGLDAAAIERVMTREGVQQMKGQLLEEILAVQGRQRAAALTAAHPNSGVTYEFVDGFRVRDAANRQLSDGLILAHEGGQTRVVTIFESKAGRASARGLRSEYESLQEVSELAEELTESRRYAIDLFRERHPHLNRLTPQQIESTYRTRIDQIERSLPRTEPGQLRRTVERLVPNEGEATTTILIDGNAVAVSAGQRTTQVVGVLPSNVRGQGILNAARQQGLNVDVVNVAMSAQEIERLATDIATALGQTTF